ncbi:Major facilitator superfamily protein [gamma proteobacterium HdN1]|nr:Major facilitator superfamily protein [gamma proteobacterium HdN1]
MGVLACLYITQGIPFGFFSHALPAILRDYGVDLKTISIISFFAFPWSLKFLWAPVLDRYGNARIGHRKSWIFPLQACVVALLVMIALLQPQSLAGVQLVWLVGLLLLVNFAAATQDIATDGLAVTTLAAHERGYGNSIQVSGFRVGMVVGGGATLLLMGTWGWCNAFLGMALLIVLATLPLLWFREPALQPEPVAGGARHPSLWSVFRSFLRVPGVRAWLLIVAVFKLGDSLGSGMARPLLVDVGLSLQEIGVISGVIGMVASIVGALLGGRAVVVLGCRRALLWLGGLQAVSMLGYAWISHVHAGWWAAAFVVSIEHVVGSMATVALYTGMMDVCRKSCAGSDFTLQASLLAGASGLVYLLSGFSADQFGYFNHYLLAVAVALLALLPVYFWRDQRVE